MPVIKSAKKKLRQDNKRKKANEVIRKKLSLLIKNAKKNPSTKTVGIAQKALGKAAKNHLLHKNKAARITSALFKLLSSRKSTKSRLKTPPNK